jgi:IstB-like ATP binding protein
MSLQTERLLNHMLRLRLSHLPNCFEAIAEEASTKNLPYLDFLEQALEAESQAKHTRNVRLKTQWAHFPYNKGLDQFDFDFQPSVDERKLRELAGRPTAQSNRGAVARLPLMSLVVVGKSSSQRWVVADAGRPEPGRRPPQSRKYFSFEMFRPNEIGPCQYTAMH